MEPVTVRVAVGETLLLALAREGVFLEARCGGLSRCGECAVEVLSGPPGAGPRGLACREDRPGVWRVRPARPLAIPPADFPATPPSGRRLGLAVDLGTTTVGAALVDLADGRVIAEDRARNLQVAYGADVLARVRAGLDPAHRDRLAFLARRAIAALALGLLRSAGLSPADLAAARLAGNASMTLLLLGRDPRGAAFAPFEPGLAAEGALAVPPEAQAVPVPDTLFLPALGGHVGSDTTAAVLAAGLLDGPQPALLVDLGTNGEAALGARGALLVTSAAAGPAFEGGGLTHGSPAVPGAVERVWREGGAIRAATVGGDPPRTWCGSGVVDLLAALREDGALDASGRLLRPVPLPVPFDQSDVREAQLAKGALAAAQALLLREAGLAVRDLRRVVLTGAFGTRLSADSARRIGLVPDGPPAEALPGGALRGAALALAPDGLARATDVARRARHVPLGERPDFEEAFAAAMALEAVRR